jgi:hypothetical protein
MIKFLRIMSPQKLSIVFIHIVRTGRVRKNHAGRVALLRTISLQKLGIILVDIIRAGRILWKWRILQLNSLKVMSTLRPRSGSVQFLLAFLSF